VSSLRDEFLSEEDLDLRSLTEAELHAYWDLWLRQAQVTNDSDRDMYSHGVFAAPGASLGQTRNSCPIRRGGLLAKDASKWPPRSRWGK